jgi:cytochrome P450
VFEEPRRFDPARTHARCRSAGIHFVRRAPARTELETAIKLVFERFPNMTLAPGRPVEIVGGVLRGPRELWVRPAG